MLYYLTMFYINQILLNDDLKNWLAPVMFIKILVWIQSRCLFLFREYEEICTLRAYIRR
jgi:hypothetical protein